MTRTEFNYFEALWQTKGVHIAPCATGLKMVAAVAVTDAHFNHRPVADLYDVAQEREVETLRQETAADRPPLWVALPVQVVCCVLYTGFLAFLGMGFLAAGALYVLFSAASAIARGVRRVLSC